MGKSILYPVYDRESGVHASVLLHDKRTRLQFDGGYMLIGFGVFESLSRTRTPDGQKLPRDAYDVYFWLLQNVRFRNVVTRYSYTRIATEMNIVSGRSRVCRMIALLELAGCVQRGSGDDKALVLNPNHCFWGTRAEQADAKAEWLREKMRLEAQLQSSQSQLRHHA